MLLSPLAVVRIELGHAEAFHNCLDEVAREARWLAQTQAPPLARLRAFVQDNVANQVPQFVALDSQGRVLGWCDIIPGWAAAERHCGRLGMGVRAAHRGRGLGERLLRATLQAAEAQGVTRVELQARADNLAAIGLYQKLGFVHEATKPCALRFEEAYIDAVQMRRLCGDAVPVTIKA